MRIKTGYAFCVITLGLLLQLLPWELSAQQIVLPAGFTWNQIPSDYKGKTLVIRNHFRLNQTDVQLPPKAILVFKGGSLTGYRSLVADQNEIRAGNQKILDPRGTIKGNFRNTEARPEWFGAKGDGVANDGPAVAAAITAFGNVRFSGKYHIPGIRIEINRPTVLTGEKSAAITGDGSNEGLFDVKNSLCVQKLSFSRFRFGFYFNQNDTLQDIRFLNCSFSEMEKPVFAPISNTVQTLTRIRISGNRFTNCVAGVELFARLNDVVITQNQFLNLGDKNLQKQSNAIRLGNTAHNYHIDKALGDFTITGNTIRNVFCGQNLQGGEGFECHGIFALGNRITISGNTLENIYNGGVKQSTRIRTGSEGIYVKANHCLITGNTLINAGFGEGSVAVKGFNTDVSISKNTILYTEDLADYSQLITASFSGEIQVTDNTLESMTHDGIAMKLCGPAEAPVKALITRNTISGVNGWGFKIINQSAGSLYQITNNPMIRIKGDFLSEESKKPYRLICANNDLQITHGSFLPSSKNNELEFTGNRVLVSGTGKTNAAAGRINFSGNKITVESSANESFIIFYQQAELQNNTFFLKGAWRFFLAFDGEYPATLLSNVFDAQKLTGNVERLVYINHKSAGLTCSISRNRFTGSAAYPRMIPVSVSNKGLGMLLMENNESDTHIQVFLDIMSPVGKAVFSNNKSASPKGFATTASLGQIGHYESIGNLQLPDHKP
ncbi:MAG TPA: hypothetical protein P5228_01840 [Bacteroidales bacterium]|nr:hypothetical protein [Bacteroidales bacterium]HRZ48237.1 hypothetical protein [Bacteroidales bacterium]